MRLLFVLLWSYVIGGCAIPTYEDYVGQWTGMPVQKYLEIYARKDIGPPAEYKLDNGNNVYIVLIGSKCKVHWEVDENGIMKNVYKTEGDCNF